MVGLPVWGCLGPDPKVWHHQEVSPSSHRAEIDDRTFCWERLRLDFSSADMEVSNPWGYPQSASILMGVFFRNHHFWVPYLWKPPYKKGWCASHGFFQAGCNPWFNCLGAPDEILCYSLVKKLGPLRVYRHLPWLPWYRDTSWWSGDSCYWWSWILTFAFYWLDGVRLIAIECSWLYVGWRLWQFYFFQPHQPWSPNRERCSDGGSGMEALLRWILQPIWRYQWWHLTKPGPPLSSAESQRPTQSLAMNLR